ncbi:uncharacterized protein LOC125186146 [Salvia hispanica]|uniref:uncharacterized protein LOC125186146 n=1 Tax=Salvia hispanica TaxID=49212 RepID=UPI0020099AFB|nr:uncharacterized protein LOC125186146 [Salvia hispanica]XP_047938438.1 uncharacterized protein LOC125186146 [Salvia hispanica]
MPATDSNWFNVFELEDKHKHRHRHKHKQDPITKFDFPQASRIEGSANGLLLLKNPFIDHLYICNPITREFVELHGRLTHPLRLGDCYGFGVSKLSGQHKIVYINPRYSGCHIYTLGTGSLWRRVKAAAPLFRRSFNSAGVLVNGNLHWPVTNDNWFPYICCFDLETESFSTFSAPVKSLCGMLFTLGGCLCFSDDVPCSDDNKLWLLKEYEQVEKVWCKVHCIVRRGEYIRVFVDDMIFGQDVLRRLQPINIYRNGDMLLLFDEKLFLYYSQKRRSIREIGVFGKMGTDCYYINSILLYPSFLSLKRNFGMKNVISF